MALTQVASGFIGDLTDQITIDKATGVYSRYGNIIHVTDGQTDDIRAIVTAKNVLDNEHRVNIKDHVDTFYAELIGMQDYDEHIVKGNRLIIPAENEGEYNEFVIDEVEDRRSHAKTIELTAYASYLDLRKAKAIEPFSRTGTAREHMFFALSDTEFEVGLVESDREITISFENWTNPYEYLLRIAREFELELDFKVMHNGYTVTNRVVDAVQSLGRFRGREVTFGKDLQEINRKEVGDIYTALIGLGPERDDGSRLEVFVEDIDALKRWGRPKHAPKHLIGVYEPQSEREDMTLEELRQYTQTELNKRKNSVIQYEVSFLDLEHLLGDEAKKIRKGDTILIKDTYFTPHLYVEARVIEVRRNVVVPAQKEYVLGDFIEHDVETVHDLYKYVKRELAKKASVERLLNKAAEAEKNAKEYADQEYGPVKDTVEQNQNVWNRAAIFNEDGTLNTNVLKGVLTDEQIESAARWNAQGTYIDENGVYTGIIVAEQIIGGSLIGEEFYGGTFKGAEFEQVGTDGSMLVDDDGIKIFNRAGDLRAAILLGGTQGIENTLGLTLIDNNESVFEINQDGEKASIYSKIDLELESENDISIVRENTEALRIIENGQIYIPTRAISRGINIGGHVITRHNTDDSLVIYPDRRSDSQNIPIFRIRSHINRDNYIENLRIMTHGEIRVGREISLGDTASASKRLFRIRLDTYFERVYFDTNTGYPMDFRNDEKRISILWDLYYKGVPVSSSNESGKILMKNISANPYKLLEMKVYDYYDKQSVETYADILSKGIDVPSEQLPLIRRIPGLSANEAHDLGLNQFVFYDKNNEVEGLMYNRLWILLIPIARDHEQRLNEYDNRFGTIESRIDKLEQEMDKLKGVV